MEKLLDDELRLWRHVDGTSGKKLDEVTGELKPGDGTAAPLWEGPGAVVRTGQLSFVPPLDGAVAALPTPTAYQALLPLTAPPAAVDDVLSVSRSVRDPQLVGRWFRVADVGVGTYSVVRVLRLDLAE
ncbi:DUF6093 family protein [Streptomyces sp. UG1]|uniref:DUF6093 family protein n=1 Tax=Streptomyces sp. UG1 TaxID=3417652 RepID=UPI003CF56BEC